MGISRTETTETTENTETPAVHFEAPVAMLLAAVKRGASRGDWIVRFVTFLLPTVLLGVVILQPWAEAELMFLDPLTAAELTGASHVHYGFVSMLGVMLWTITTSVCLFTAVLLALTGRLGAAFRFALTAGLLTGWLALDDAFLVHEKVMPALGVPQNLALAVNVGLAVAYLVASWRIILDHDFWILLMGGVALVGSIVIDTVFHSVDPVLVQLEDSAKFFGIFCWTSFHVTTLARYLIQRYSAKPVRPTG